MPLTVSGLHTGCVQEAQESCAVLGTHTGLLTGNNRLLTDAWSSEKLRLGTLGSGSSAGTCLPCLRRAGLEGTLLARLSGPVTLLCASSRPRPRPSSPCAQGT